MNKCKVCGQAFEPSKYHPSQKYCDRKCYTIAHRIQCRDNMAKRRKLYGTVTKTNSIRHGTSQLSDTSIVEVNGQKRVLGAVVLEKMMKRKRR